MEKRKGEGRIFYSGGRDQGRRDENFPTHHFRVVRSRKSNTTRPDRKVAAMRVLLASRGRAASEPVIRLAAATVVSPALPAAGHYGASVLKTGSARVHVAMQIRSSFRGVPVVKMDCPIGTRVTERTRNEFFGGDLECVKGASRAFRIPLQRRLYHHTSTPARELLRLHRGIETEDDILTAEPIMKSAALTSEQRRVLFDLAHHLQGANISISSTRENVVSRCSSVTAQSAEAAASVPTAYTKLTLSPIASEDAPQTATAEPSLEEEAIKVKKEENHAAVLQSTFPATSTHVTSLYRRILGPRIVAALLRYTETCKDRATLRQLLVEQHQMRQQRERCQQKQQQLRRNCSSSSSGNYNGSSSRSSAGTVGSAAAADFVVEPYLDSAGACHAREVAGHREELTETQDECHVEDKEELLLQDDPEWIQLTEECKTAERDLVQLILTSRSSIQRRLQQVAAATRTAATQGAAATARVAAAPSAATTAPSAAAATPGGGGAAVALAGQPGPTAVPAVGAAGPGALPAETADNAIIRQSTKQRCIIYRAESQTHGVRTVGVETQSATAAEEMQRRHGKSLTGLPVAWAAEVKYTDEDEYEGEEENCSDDCSAAILTKENQKIALESLRKQLKQRIHMDRQQQRMATEDAQVGGKDRSEKIRTYNFQRDTVTDHRRHVHGVKAFLDSATGLSSLLKELQRHKEHQNLCDIFQQLRLAVPAVLTAEQ